MIPDHLIDRAWRAYTWANNAQAIRNEMAYPDLRGPMPPPPDPRLSMRAALEAVAAEIWREGYQLGYCREPRPDWANADDNPYRTQETA